MNQTAYPAHQKTRKITPHGKVSNRHDMIPFPLRIASSQNDRLDVMRAITGISVQEHIRRAIDLYLSVVEREQIELGLMPERQINQSPKVVKR